MRQIVFAVIVAAALTVPPVIGQGVAYSPIYPAPASTAVDSRAYTLRALDADSRREQASYAAHKELEPQDAGNRYWLEAEFLLWWLRDSQLPPLVTTGPQASGGILGQPGTRVLFGGQTAHDPMPGARITAGMWYDDCQTRGSEMTLLYLPSNSARDAFSSDGSPLLARPFFDVTLGMQNSQLVAADGIIAGSVAVSLDSELWSPEFNCLCNLCQDRCGRYRWDFLYGLRYLNFEEDLTIRELLTDVNTGDQFDLTDRFRTANRFLGPQLGFRGQWRQGRCRLEGTGKIAVGGNHQNVTIDGQTIITDAVGSDTFQGGLLALPSNIGSYNRMVFAVVPEVNLKASWMWNKRCETYVGYNFLFVSNVVRPGEQIDLRVNPTQLPGAPVPFTGPAFPAFRFEGTEFWVHGVCAGLRFNF